MKPSLYEHMPYGAPELIETRETHLSRATMLATAMAVATLGAAHALVTVMPVTVSVPPPVNRCLCVTPTPIPFVPAVPKLRTKTTFQTSSVPDATPLPVPDPAALTEDPLYGGTSESQLDAGQEEQANAIPKITLPPPAYDVFVPIEHLPVVVREVKPIYPPIAEQAGIEGRVTVGVLVGTDGRVLDTHVVRSVPMLDEAAVTAARQWVFTPGLNNDHAVACWVSIPFVFRLH